MILTRKFKLKDTQSYKKEQRGISKEDVIGIVNSCSYIRLKTYVSFSSWPGFRAVGALFVRIKDLELKPARVFVTGEYTKIKTKTNS
jgi:hypothetical protein